MNSPSNIINLKSLQSGILQISLNRPAQLNALNFEVLNLLNDILIASKTDKSVKGILLTGEGKGFCAGADITELASLTGAEGVKFAQLGQSVFDHLERLGKPTLVAIHGFAFGGGCELAMAATLRIATTKAMFGQPEIKLGVIPGFGGTQRLPRLIGKGRALEICLTGKKFSAEDAYRWGFLNEVTSEEELIPKALELLSLIVTYSPSAINSIISVINQGLDASIDEALELEAAYFGVCCSTKDKQEGVSAFLEKRKPQFQGA